MALTYEDLRILQAAEGLADSVWKQVVGWDVFAREAMGKQLIGAADSVGANVAEALGRYHYGERLTFLYYARGSLFETKYWLNRAVGRGLLTDETLRAYVAGMGDLARQLNSFVAMIRKQRTSSAAAPKTVREPDSGYRPDSDLATNHIDLFDVDDLAWLES